LITDLEENIDYIVTDNFVQNSSLSGGRPSKEYFLTIDAARELYEFLEIREDFTDWFKRYLQYGFIEKDDYIIYLENRVNSDNRRGRPSVDYLMTT
jgi:phage anti-repressor protein